MSVLIVAKKDFRDAIRSRTILLLTLLFAVFTVGGVIAGSQIPRLIGTRGDQSLDIVFGLLSPTSLFIPIISLLVGYKAVAGERETGSLKCLLALPHTRRDVVLGKVIGRTGVVTVSILIGFSFGAVALALFSDSLPLVTYFMFTILSILLGLLFVCLSIAISSATASTTRAAWGAFGLYALFQFVWGLLGFLLVFITTGSLPLPPVPDWYLLFTRLNPQSAYQNLATALLPGASSVTGALSGGSARRPPFFSQGWFSGVVLALWIIVPLGLGYRSFERADL